MGILRLKMAFSLSIFFCILNISAYSQELFISKNGNDKNPGTRDKPLASFEAAQLKARKIKGPVTVFIREGTYYFTKPLVFTSLDSRKPNEALKFTPYLSEKVTISSAAHLKLKWEPYRGNILKAKAPKGILFDQIFVNGIKQRMARYPNYDSTSSHFGGYSVDVLSPDKIKSWKNPKGAFIHALHKHEWGGYHYLVTGKDENGQLRMEGGFQNNRQMGMHDQYRFIENVFEELDTHKEWYYDSSSGYIYLYTENPSELTKAEILSPQLKSLIEFRGNSTQPVKNISIEGFEFRHVFRTFMDTKEPLLRSDWAIFRGGAVVLEGTENCTIVGCHFKEIGGNAVFFSNYNKKSEVSGCHIENIGASGVCFVGDPKAVRSPSFEYNESIDYALLDKEKGPKSNNYPMECKVHDNLMHDLGQVEKQVAGVQISMAMNITVSHNTIYDLPRSGINVSEGTWGGHVIEFNDVFNTVLETGDHGSFNSWGRDRFWHPNRIAMDSLVSKHPELILLDAQNTVIIRNNRFRCDHGWDIDLDDGSSNYHIYNNLCLNGGLKLREGFKRTVENNILVNNSFHPHVWFKNSEDVFRKNIVLQPYYPIQIKDWGKEIDYNLFPDDKALLAARANHTDQHSLAGDPLFVDPSRGDYTVKKESPALRLGFKNFPMDKFGVISPSLKGKAKQIPLPTLNITTNTSSSTSEKVWLGAKLKNIQGLGDRSAYGLPDEHGVIVDDITPLSVLSKSPLQKGDVLRKINTKEIHNYEDLMNVYQEISWTGRSTVEVIRNQKSMIFEVSFK
jgi:hypothetical protein